MKGTMPDILRLAIETGLVTNPPGKSPYHGDKHWKSVALVGLHLSRQTPGASMPIIFTFAMLHDLCRLHDSNPGEGPDPEHGHRAAAMFLRMVDSPGVEEFPPYEGRTEILAHAIACHVEAQNGEGLNVNVGLCWDADRLTLPRVGIVPDDRYLTTDAAKLESSKDFALHLCIMQRNGYPFPSWTEIRKETEEYRWP